MILGAIFFNMASRVTKTLKILKVGIYYFTDFNRGFFTPHSFVFKFLHFWEIGVSLCMYVENFPVITFSITKLLHTAGCSYFVTENVTKISLFAFFDST